MANKIDKAEHYYRQGRELIDTVIESELVDSNLIVHGNRAINVYLPEWLDKHTEDWDLFSMTPEQTAKELEKLLDEHYGGDFFRVTPAKHEGTFRIVNNVTLKGVADITLPKRRIDYITKDDINYATLEHHVERIKAMLADPTRGFRRKKDLETLQRIKIFKRLQARRRKVIIPIVSEFKAIRD